MKFCILLKILWKMKYLLFGANAPFSIIFFKYVVFHRQSQKVLVWSKGLSCSIFNILSGLGMGVKIFIINYIYNKYPRLKKKYDNTHRLWLTLPTDVQYDKKFVRDEVDKVRFWLSKAISIRRYLSYFISLSSENI